jgi:hypothetical protein
MHIGLREREDAPQRDYRTSGPDNHPGNLRRCDGRRADNAHRRQKAAR